MKPDGFLQDYFVEVDVVMDASTPLWKAHDISQQLQDRIEVLPNVGRAFVHVDHETTHIPVSGLTTSPVSLSPVSIGTSKACLMRHLYTLPRRRNEIRLTTPLRDTMRNFFVVLFIV